MKKVSKAILIGLAVMVALGVAFVFSLNLYIQSPGSQARIQEELSKSLRLPLKLTNVSVSPFGNLTITGITIPNGGVNFLDAASFHARYRLLPVLHGKLVITEMSVETPKILWVQAADGRWKLPQPEQAESVASADASQTLKEQTKKPEPERGNPEATRIKTEAEKEGAAEKKSAFEVLVERFEVKDGAVELFDSEKKHVAVLTDVNMVYTSLTSTHIEGTATIGKVVWSDALTFENVKTPFKVAGSTVDLSDLAATFAGGSLQGKYHTHSENGRSPYKVAATFVQLDLDRLAVQMGAAPGQTSGALSGQIEIHGDAERSGKLEGEGRLDLRDAQFHQLDLFQNIGAILSMRELSDLRVRDGHSDLRLAGEKVLIDKLTLNTSDLQLDARGTARLDKRLNLEAQLSAEDAVIQRLPGMIRDNFLPTDNGRRAIAFNVTGSADKPKTNLLDKLIGQRINNQFGDVLNSLFGSEKKPDEPKKDDKKKKKDKDKEKDSDKAAAAAAAAIQSVGRTLQSPQPATPAPQPAAPNP